MFDRRSWRKWEPCKPQSRNLRQLVGWTPCSILIICLGLANKSRSMRTLCRTSTAAWRPYKRKLPWLDLKGRYSRLESWHYHLTGLDRPDVRKQILQHCSACTRADVALNNLVVRARTPAKCQTSYQILQSSRYQSSEELQKSKLLQDHEANWEQRQIKRFWAWV